MRKNNLSFMAAILLLAGCATQKFVFDANKASAYLATHQDRPAHIASALSAGRPVVGMTEAEVELCWGTPQKKMSGESDGVSKVSWGYFEPQVVARSGLSLVWCDVLVKEIQFTNGVARAWRESGSGQ